ncbi:PH, RCC1 and FYVE domains-containing protein 1 isoform X2 [Aegilops tauschii subsp. strangulata]|nr:PH, RCC1 and FYVE domains-containing protein 1 isoform X2 [Aegilops tauschii subsp. strangulata]XP_044420379.1 PH, RCC1 and FYVE domains-containing protein 1-like [Triticum aestivum]
MAGELEGRSSGTRGAEQAIVALKKGAHLLKCGKRGKPRFCPFRLSCDEKLLIWYSKEREKSLSLSSVSSVVLGQKTTNLLRLHWPEKEHHSLSVIYKNGEYSLDLICKDKDQADCWYLGLTALVSALYSPLLLVDSTSSRRINSCTNSPPSYIQQRNRLFSVDDTRKFTQVHSLYGSPRLIQNKVSKSSLDCSEAFVTPRQRTWSDLDFYLERITPEMVNRVKNSFMDIPVAAKIQEGITQMPKLKASEGSHMACGIDSLKDIFAWGEVPGSVLENGDAPKDNVSLPRLLKPTQILDVQNVACGEKHAAIVTKQGEVFSWGKESGGILGHKVSVSVSEPTIIKSLSSIPMKAIAFGAKHTCALAISGELYEWGEGTHSLGLWDDQCQRSQWFPHKLFDPLDGVSVLKIACGQWHTAIISSSGQLFTYGDGTFGVLGHGDTMSVARPKEVESLKGLRAKAVACGPWHTAAIVEILGTVKSNAPSGKLFTWGDADKGKLGHADKKSKLVPTCVKPLNDSDFAQVSCAKALTVVLTITGVVFTIGSTLGNRRLSDTSICSVEGPLKTEFVRDISSGSSHVAVLTMNGKVYTWGKGTEGQLGLGDYTDRSSPTLVESLEDKQVDSIACGSNFTLAVCLHRSISGKDQSVCSSCQLSFTFTRKKHNCYNCGSMFCNSCSSNKVSRAALGPDRSKRYRVCDVCFTQLQKIEGHGTLSSQSAIQKEEAFPTEIRPYTPKLSRIFKEANSIMEKMTTAQGSNQRNQDLAAPVQLKTQRWGQVECPSQFKCARNNIPCCSIPNKQTVDVSLTQRMPEPVPPKGTSSMPETATNLKAELDSTENILLGEVKQLQAQVTTLAEQCRHRSLKVQLYKRKVEETWLIIMNEAAKCKAAKEIIKVLTNQKNTLSKKIDLAGGQSYNSITIPSHGQPVKAELPDPPDKNPVTGKFQQLSSIRDHHQQVDRERIQSSSAAVAKGSATHRNGRRAPSNSNTYAGENDATIPPVDPNGTIEQIERGVYVTVVTSPGGNKGVKRIRFSRKHFGEKEAQKWWEANESKVFAKYSGTEQVTE